MLMPRCDGPTLVRALRGDPSYVGLKIFGVTGSSFDRFGLDEGPTGIDRWFRKPLNPEHLLRDLKADLRPAAEPGDALKTTAV
jgi:CheY-like chemotaxis protein